MGVPLREDPRPLAGLGEAQVEKLQAAVQRERGDSGDGHGRGTEAPRPAVGEADSGDAAQRRGADQRSRARRRLPALE
jgi:hypothetical protein